MYAHFYRHKEKYTGAFLLLSAEIVVLLGGIFFVSSYYDALTVGAGTSESFAPKKLIKPTFEEKKVLHTGDTIQQYSGTFGVIILGEKTSPGSRLNHTKMILKTVNIDSTKIQQFLYAKSLYEKKIIDQYLLLYLTTLPKESFKETLTNLDFLGRYTPAPLVIPQQEDVATATELLATQASQGKYEDVLATIQSYETYLEKASKSDLSQKLTSNFVSSPEFLYLLEKMNIDTENMYKDHISFASQTFGISPNLIKAAILSEQLRGFFTYRGLMKQVIASQKYIMVMQQMSWGIGGVKEKTARKIESFVATFYPNIRKKNFAFSSTQGTAIDQERYARLTNTQNYFYQIMYVAANLAMNQQQWHDAGIDISKNPGVLLTLYNIGDREPRKNPEIGGADFIIAGQKFSFGGLGMFLYYLLEIYG